MPAITKITAALMLLFDSMLDAFAGAGWTEAGTACGLNVVNVSLTNCGISLVDALSDLASTMTESFSTMLPGLSVL